MFNKLISGITLLVLLASPLAAQQYYRWVDENGTMHFSESPPEVGVDADLEQVKDSHLTRGLSNSVARAVTSQPTTPPQSSTASATQSVLAAPPQTVGATPAANAEPDAESESVAEICEKIRINLETLDQAPEVRRVDPDTGEAHTLNQEEHQLEVERARALQQEYCL